MKVLLGIEREAASPKPRILFTAGSAGTKKPQREIEEADLTQRRAPALRIWEQAQDPRGTLVEDYLTAPKPKGRGLRYPDDLEALRFHPACPWRDDDTGELLHVPAMVAAMRNIHTDEITGIHRTRLTADGQKIGRKMLGVASSAAIKIDPDEAVTHGLIIGEGIETCLAARQLGFQPVWALGSEAFGAGRGSRECPRLDAPQAADEIILLSPERGSKRDGHSCG